MEPHEIMTSESQERMLAIVEPSGLDEVMAICDRWEVRATVIGRVTEGGRLRILDGRRRGDRGRARRLLTRGGTALRPGDRSGHRHDSGPC